MFDIIINHPAFSSLIEYAVISIIQMDCCVYFYTEKFNKEYFIYTTNELVSFITDLFEMDNEALSLSYNIFIDLIEEEYPP